MTGSTDGRGAAQSPEELRVQVEETRRELGDTVEALAARADVKAQARQKATRLKGQVSDTAHTVGEKTRSNPGVPVAAGAAVAALALVLLTRRRGRRGRRGRRH
ncbi:DUF3618 domain-containing protein [Streptomyces albus subsp. chlorinus]|uniref:DUF3618 domain-containing protein n=1 Tax=Streptomyces albus TaxID=1888 RepID=UPI0015704FDA|nr:DUF3618 domain-containing protein [Streptomyces albus]NSC22468.1 DUF3618 domain-containing protein [Streptomyces albus subsp. chlorinus]